jgi:lysyl-tRNA synthetase class 2
MDTSRTSPWLPRLAAFAAAFIGLVNIGSALSPNVRWRGHLLLQYEPIEAIRMFHALALPAGAALLLVSPYLLKRRRRAWQAAILLMFVLGLFDLFKGLDFEETVITWGAAGALGFARDAFKVHSNPITVRSALWRAPLVAAGGLAVVALGTWTSQADAMQVLAAITLPALAYVSFRPLAGPRILPGPDSRAAAAQIVQEHGTDTLSFFKLRADKHYFFSDGRDAFVAYRIENGVLLLSGDPVGAPEAFPGLIEQLKRFAQARGLRLGAVGAHERLCPLYEEFGLRTIYLGDEAIIELGKFSLEGRPIRKVRQSVTRLTKAGYTAELQEYDRLDPETLAAVERVLELGREGAPERGFSMAMDRIDGDHAAETLLLLTRDEQHELRGVLQFVPCYGRPAVSLSFMRRDPATPNGLTEFMVCSAADLLRERGLEEMSLNFATFARYMHSPETGVERLLGWVAKKFNPYFQIESLYRFNAKFFPRWESRYLVYEGALGLPRAGLAAAWAEGQVWKPARPERPVLQRRVGQLIG